MWLNHDHDLVDVHVVPSSATTAAASAVASATTAVVGQTRTGHGLLVSDDATTAVHLVVHQQSTSSAVAGETIHTTANHPWLTADRGWVQAGQLQPGEPVVTLNGSSSSSSGTVAWVHVVPGQADMYNLTVANDHTYAVGSGQWVVHNTNCPHRVEVTIYDEAGNVRTAYGTWSGNATPGERALGGWDAQRFTDTENRVARMSGATPRRPVADDPYAGVVPVRPGETVVIRSLMGKALCNSCKNAMIGAARQLDATFIYQWAEDGIDQSWRTSS